IAIGKIAISIISAYAVVYFKFPLRMPAFWVIFMTLMLPVEVRIYPTYKIAADLHMLDSYAGLTIPLIASATATLFFRQFFMTIPDELIEASKLDGAGPFRFFKDTVLPLSRTNIAALFVILFIFGWNQYLWPLLITTRDDMQTIVIGIKKMIVTADALTEWNVVLATAMLAMLPPVGVVVLTRRWFAKGLADTEKCRRCAQTDPGQGTAAANCRLVAAPEAKARSGPPALPASRRRRRGRFLLLTAGAADGRGDAR